MTRRVYWPKTPGKQPTVVISVRLPLSLVNRLEARYGSVSALVKKLLTEMAEAEEVVPCP